MTNRYLPFLILVQIQLILEGRKNPKVRKSQPLSVTKGILFHPRLKKRLKLLGPRPSD